MSKVSDHIRQGTPFEVPFSISEEKVDNLMFDIVVDSVPEDKAQEFLSSLTTMSSENNCGNIDSLAKLPATVSKDLPYDKA